MRRKINLMELKGLVSRLAATDYGLIEDGVVPAEDLPSVLAHLHVPSRLAGRDE